MSDGVNVKVKIWFTDGSILQNCNLTSADLKVFNMPFDISRLDKMDDAFLYCQDGTKIYRRDNVTGSVELTIAGLAGTVKLPQDKINELQRIPA